MVADNFIVPFEDLAKQVLTLKEQDELADYISNGGRPLSVETAAKFFELFLAGNNVDDIVEVNKAFPKAAINWCRVKYGWDQKRDDCITALAEKTREKVIRAQFETTSLVSDLLIAAATKHGDAIKKFLMTRNPKDLPPDLNIDSIGNLIRLAESLQKLTGQDRTLVVKGDIKSTNVNRTETAVEVKTPEGMSPEAAAKILEIVAEEKRRGAK